MSANQVEIEKSFLDDAPHRYGGTVIDLHTHSTCSDGSESPARVVELAAAAGCSALALTDHDGMSGIAEATHRADELGIELIPGCEVSCDFSPGSLHLLCYFIDDGANPLSLELSRLRTDRLERNDQLIEKLRQLGIEISIEEVAAQAPSEVIGRPHFAKVLLEKGIVSSPNDAFDRYLGKGAPAYVERAPLEPSRIIEVARASGGVAVIAHPLSLGMAIDDLERGLAPLCDAGLSGLECFYGTYDPDLRDELARIAHRLGLVATGGSDFHGAFKPDLNVGTGLGDLAVDDAVLENLREAKVRLSPLSG